MRREVLRHGTRSGEVIHRVSPGLSTSSSLRNDAKLNGLCRHRSGAASEITFWMNLWVGSRQSVQLDKGLMITSSFLGVVGLLNATSGITPSHTLITLFFFLLQSQP